MKALVLIAALLGGGSVYAKCVEGSKATFQESNSINDHQKTIIRTCKNGSYYDLSSYVYNPSNKCKEGARSFFTEIDQNDRSVTVIRTCTNGSYYPVTRTVGAKCKEGAVTWDRGESLNDRGGSIVKKTCVGGKYVQN